MITKTDLLIGLLNEIAAKLIKDHGFPAVQQDIVVACARHSSSTVEYLLFAAEWLKRCPEVRALLDGPRAAPQVDRPAEPVKRLFRVCLDGDVKNVTDCEVTKEVGPMIEVKYKYTALPDGDKPVTLRRLVDPLQIHPDDRDEAVEQAKNLSKEVYEFESPNEGS